MQTVPILVLAALVAFAGVVGLVARPGASTRGERGAMTKKTMGLLAIAALVVGAAVYVVANRDGDKVSQVPDGRPASEGE